MQPWLEVKEGGLFSSSKPGFSFQFHRYDPVLCHERHPVKIVSLYAWALQCLDWRVHEVEQCCQQQRQFVIGRAVPWLFQSRYHQAKMSVTERTAKVAAVVESLERDMELLCVTGVEDKLHDGVRTTLELLRNAGIKVFTTTLPSSNLFTSTKEVMFSSTLVCLLVSRSMQKLLHQFSNFHEIRWKGGTWSRKKL